MKKQKWRLFLAILLYPALMTCISCGVKKGDPPGPHEEYGARAEKIIYNVPYVPSMPDNKDLALDVYYNPHHGEQPVAVMVHGGGWREGDKSMDNKVWICKVLANHGYVVFSLNYRLLPEASMKQQAEDVMAAVIWVKEHAGEYGGDPERVGIVGGSAGGHLAALVAWASDDPYFRPTGHPQSDYDSDVKVAGLYYPVLDIDRTFKDVGDGLSPLAGLYFTGKAGDEYREALEHLSPHNHVDRQATPTIFLTGDADELDLYPQSVEYTEKLRELGIDSELYTARDKKHGFTWNYWEEESVESVEALVSFFDKHLKLNCGLAISCTRAP